MIVKQIIIAAVLATASAGFSQAAQEAAVPEVKRLSLKECGAQYQTAKADGSLAGKKWMDYRRDICGIAGRSPTQPALLARSEASTAELIRRVSFPSGMNAPVAGETPARARMRTCLESYRGNKQAGTLYGLRWVQKGGGYYSLCNARLKAVKA